MYSYRIEQDNLVAGLYGIYIYKNDVLIAVRRYIGTWEQVLQEAELLVAKYEKGLNK